MRFRPPIPLTGLAVAEASGARVVVGIEGDDCAYDPWRRVIVLSPSVAKGVSAGALVSAAHEAAHHQQNLERPWLFAARCFEPVRWMLEIDAWRRAVRMLL